MLTLNKLNEIEERTGNPTEQWLYRYIVQMDENDRLMDQMAQLERYAKKAEQHLFPPEFGPERYHAILRERSEDLMRRVVDTEAVYLEIEDALHGLPKKEHDIAVALYLDGQTASDVRDQLGCSLKTLWNIRQKIIKYVEEKLHGTVGEEEKT